MSFWGSMKNWFVPEIIAYTLPVRPIYVLALKIEEPEGQQAQGAGDEANQGGIVGDRANPWKPGNKHRFAVVKLQTLDQFLKDNHITPPANGSANDDKGEGAPAGLEQPRVGDGVGAGGQVAPKGDGQAQRGGGKGDHIVKQPAGDGIANIGQLLGFCPHNVCIPDGLADGNREADGF